MSRPLKWSPTFSNRRTLILAAQEGRRISFRAVAAMERHARAGQLQAVYGRRRADRSDPRYPGSPSRVERVVGVGRSLRGPAGPDFTLSGHEQVQSAGGQLWRVRQAWVWNTNSVPLLRYRDLTVELLEFSHVRNWLLDWRWHRSGWQLVLNGASAVLEGEEVGDREDMAGFGHS